MSGKLTLAEANSIVRAAISKARELNIFGERDGVR
jgi:hypothetical protein